MFINYTVNNGLTLNSYRDPQATVTDLTDIAEAISEDRQENLTCTIYGNEINVLEDCEYWKGSNVTIEALEKLHDLLVLEDLPALLKKQAY